MRLIVLTSFLMATCAFPAKAQITQTIRGIIKDTDSRVSLPGATVAVYEGHTFISGTSSGQDGGYRIEKVPVGRYTLLVTYVGYHSFSAPDIIVNTGKEVVLDIFLEESAVQLDSVVVTAVPKGEPSNEMAMVSARPFSVDETERYAGSRGDPARMASNFAGVQGNDDSNNGIIVRGNSPYSMQWRVENLNVPGMNHFVLTGRTNGPVSILNNKYLATSDFYTGAFPAEFGNSIGSIFNLKMRNGNNQHHEFTGQLGLFGTELFLEGPISKQNRSSYFLSYRYGTVAIFQALGISVGTNAIPYYQDGAFKLNFPGNNSNLSIFGIAGHSKIDQIQSTETDTGFVDLYSSVPSDQYFSAGKYVTGMNYGKTLNERTYLRITLGATRDHSNNEVYDVHRHIESGSFVIDSLTFDQNYDYTFDKFSLNPYLTKKLSRKHKIRLGADAEMLHFDLFSRHQDYVKNVVITSRDFRGNACFLQPYVSWLYAVSEKFSFKAGLHAQYLGLNGSVSLEPRTGFKWQLNDRQKVSFGAGLHSQMLLPFTYFSRTILPNGNASLESFNLDFMRSAQGVLAYTHIFGTVRTRLEAYYQHLYRVPVNKEPSSYSYLNQGAGYSDIVPYQLTSAGLGRNYGIELTMERFFSNSYFFLITASLFDSKYKGSDGVWYNTAFNGVYGSSILVGKEFKWEKNNQHTIGVSGKLTLAGGRRYTPIDTVASRLEGRAVYVEGAENSLQLKDYFRTDLRIIYKMNTPKITHELGIDLVNIFNTRNVLRQVYNPSEVKVVEVYQLGFLPVFFYQINF
ncbi:MAG: TonB-dependent receptor [Bacteroidia bacterium]